MSHGDVNVLLDNLSTDAALQREWELNPAAVLSRYSLTDTQRQALLDGDVDALFAEGLAERHVQQMRVSW
ncbi:hypothetical protein [Actinophytocola glycyrrhizae]|uniref:Extradiol ring-cleavage dioxygenase LigAB LigA subunit domain-containing protein n=1 Tax=Actinophytocola glycyrrhizae TaxID=2044873 RepID=A0ABV9S629_9PSEU